mgnify:CR=1 FL=1
MVAVGKRRGVRLVRPLSVSGEELQRIGRERGAGRTSVGHRRQAERGSRANGPWGSEVACLNSEGGGVLAVRTGMEA